MAFDTFVTIGVKAHDPNNPDHPDGQPEDNITLFADQDGEPGVIQLLDMFASWGPCPDPCPPFCSADLDFNCTVDVFDFLELVTTLIPFPGFGSSVLRLPNGGWGVNTKTRQGDPFDFDFVTGNGQTLIGQFSTENGTAIQGTMLLQYISNGVVTQSVESFFHGVPPTGACCQCFGSQQFCTVETEVNCQAFGGSYLGDGVDCAPPGALVATSSPAAAIPDNVPTGVSDTITITDSLTVNDLSVELEINHTWLGDLCVALSKDGGPEELLLSRIGADTGGNACHQGGPVGCNADDMHITLDDNAGATIEFACASPLIGPFQPDPGSLSAFAGLDSAGDWTLRVIDNNGVDLGTLVSWTLTLSHGSGLSRCEKELPQQCGGACPWDCADSNNIVETADFLALLAEWGMSGTPCDLGLGLVGVDTPDFLALLAAWGPCQAPGAGDCCAPNGTPGCEDVACERAVCAIDPLCCETQWDQTCADHAAVNDACPCSG